MKWSKEDKVKQKNIKGLISNPSTRPIVFLTGGLVLGMIGLGYLNMSRTSDDAVESAASVGSPINAQHVPGTSGSAIHDDLQRQQNERALQEARKQGSSSVPVLTGNVDDINDPLRLPEEVQEEVVSPPTAIYVEQQPDQQPVQTPPPVQQPPVVYAPPPAPVAPPVQAQVSDAMNDQILGYLNLWGPSNKSQQEFVYAGQQLPEQPTNMQVNQMGQYPNGQMQNAEQSQIRYVRAGSYVPAKLIIPINSDEPGPVMAEITSGPLQGARLLGAFQMGNEAVTIRFTQISKPGWPDTYPVNAVAMNENLSTAMATDVNKHYFQRYLGMLGGSYMEGYGQGMQQSQGSSTIYNPIGGVTQIRDPLNSEQIRDRALGEVARDVGQEWQRSSRRDITIKVEGENGGPLPIKVLFLDNF